MTRTEIENILPYFCNFFERNYRCELVFVDGRYRDRGINIASIIKYDFDSFSQEINGAIHESEDLKQGIISIGQLEHAIKIKHAVVAESVEYIYKNHETEFLTQLFHLFVSRISHLATQWVLLQESKNINQDL